jgi:hypothetical protein
VDTSDALASRRRWLFGSAEMDIVSPETRYASPPRIVA